MAFNWPTPELTVSDRVGIGTDTPSQGLDIIGNIAATGDISATNLTLSGSASAAQFMGNGSNLTGLVTTSGDSTIDGSLTINENLAVSGNFQLGTLSINEFSSDGNLVDNSNLAVPTEQAVKTYVDNQINTKAALNGAANQDFTAQNLTVGANLRLSGDLEVQGNVIARDTEHIEGNVSLGYEDSDVITITGVISSGHSSGALQVNSGLQTTGSVSVGGSLSVSQLNVTDRVTGSLTVENNLTVGGNLEVGNEDSCTISTPGRMHLTGGERLYLLNKAGVIIGKQWGGNGNLSVEGNLTVHRDLHINSNKACQGLKISATGKSTHIYLEVAEGNYGYLNLGGETKLRGNGEVSTFSGDLTVEGILTVESNLTVNGDMHITGSLSKGAGSFLIDHPLDPLNKTLRHSFVESPENLCLYRGKIKLDSQGRATVEMPAYFPALTKEDEATVNLTAIGTQPFLLSFQWNQEHTAFTIFGSPDAEAAYLVLADRDDPVIYQLRQPVEQEKGNGNFEKEQLLYPQAYGYPKTMGFDYHQQEQINNGVTRRA